MSPLVCIVKDHSRHQKCKKISDTLSCILFATFFFVPHFDIICDLKLKRCSMATWNLFAIIIDLLQLGNGTLQKVLFFTGGVTFSWHQSITISKRV